jgi:putative aldouronate transport system substrate-binding protein
MKRRLKRVVIALLLIGSVVLSGCGTGGNNAAESTPSVESTSSAGTGIAAETSAVEETGGKYDPVVTITAAKQLDENAGKYDPGDDINNNPMIRLGVEKLGIKIDISLLGGDAGNYDTKLRLALTGSEKLPDVFPIYNTQLISDMIESGKVKDITGDFEKYLPARLKEVYELYPETFYPVTKDGKIYGFAVTPFLTEGQIMVIRQDWLDKLGLKAPTNIDEFENVIKAFTENDPDGNGKKDTYGFTYQGNGVYNSGWVSDPVIIFSAFTGKNIVGSWQEGSDGKLVYGSVVEGNKQALSKMKQWNDKGYLFAEAAATGGNFLWPPMGNRFC